MTPVAKRKAVVHLMEVHQVSQRRACDVLQVDRSSMRYLSRRGDDAELRDAIKRVSRERRRFGCRRVHVMIAREGFVVNHKKVRRIYTEEKLQVRRRGGRKRALGTRKPMVLPDDPNQRWSLDFVSDALTDAIPQPAGRSPISQMRGISFVVAPIPDNAYGLAHPSSSHHNSWVS